MANPQVEARAENNLFVDISEQKQPLQYREVDESLSEWEAARLTSKTWSMEQE
ncbi:MAG: hypothetical protein HOC70_12075 [Gammaproteobacteria bacterium]|jgi:hypothetical protein|nr:hypothetical protein [Gammaproteobacteria bacterium]MBT4493974.1 hypothetical protein [Gammaproteobacteria bacterium]MBT7371826.1 hypothetical protein [Gammaproteobacteria bacterium]